MKTLFYLFNECKIERDDSPGEKLYQKLQAVANRFNTEEKLNRELFDDQGKGINGIVKIKTSEKEVESNKVEIMIEILNGEFQVYNWIYAEKKGTTIIFASEKDITEMMKADSEEEVRIILKNAVVIEGNPAHLSYLNYLLSCIPEILEQKKISIKKVKNKNKLKKFDLAASAGKPELNMREQRMQKRINEEGVDPKVLYLVDKRYLAHYSIDDFPRLNAFKQMYIKTKPRISAEQSNLLTDFYKEHGYEKKNDGSFWNPTLRTAEAFRYFMSKKKPLIKDNDLIAGTMTEDPVYGGIVQPYAIGWEIWGELKTISDREEEPFQIDDDDIETLHKKVFPFWMDKHIEAIWKTKVEETSKAVRVFNRKFFVIPWGLISLNPGSPGFETVVKKGLKWVQQQINKKSDDMTLDEEQQNTLKAMKIALEAVSIYTKNLKEHVESLVKTEKNKTRKKELIKLAEILDRVPYEPARTLYEALQSLWIMFIGIGLDSLNDNMSIGRLDQILQPYFEQDIKQKTTFHEKENYIKEVIEMVGCFFMRLNSHRVAINTRMAWHSSGAPTATAITIGGVTSEGKDAVNDMSYIILKTAEMLCTDDPDMDVRYMPGINSRTFLKRACEVNYITSGTPAIHNDKALINGWVANHPDWDIKDIRNWVSCGCTEPVMHGKHFAQSGDLDTNLAVPLEMALNNGNHPLWKRTVTESLGPPHIKYDEKDDNLGFIDFDDFYNFFKRQFEFIFRCVIEDGSKKIMKAQREVMPAPLYSALVDGCIRDAKGMLYGGAKYNTSGAALIGLSDVVDSLLVIKQLVFDESKITLKLLKEAIDNNFGAQTSDKNGKNETYRKIHAMIKHQVSKFGSGNETGRQMVDRVTRMIGDFFHMQQTDRGKTNKEKGNYIAGYKSASNHMVYGMVSGALPSGKLAGYSFTPGLTPSPTATKNLLDNLTDVASLDPATCENNIAYNVRLSFAKHNTYNENIEMITNYVATYFNSGGMQIQLNMVDSDTLLDAMANPEAYPDLITRISGYTGFYTKLHRELQLEIFNRTEFAL
jgi:formate C-acetyltransferase